MRKQQAVWKLISNSLSLNIPVMLLYVLQSSGSSPGRQGFAMAVNKQGAMEGSIGGGVMEHKFVELAKEQLRRDEYTVTLKQQFHDKKAAKNQSGMICSGEQTILIYTVKPDEKADIDRLINSLDHDQNGLLRLSPKGIEFSDITTDQDFVFRLKTETDWLYEEKTGYKNHLYIIGGGHCSLALSRLMNTMDFYIRIYDNRPELNTLADNDYVQEKHLINDYSELKDLVCSGKSHYVVIMTFGYRTDDAALRALLGKEFKYVGLLGSKTKIGEMFNSYISSGLATAEHLNKIHSPVGIQIKSQTPEEIAVSIAAEIIKVKNQHLN
ncbi:XdhC family protein [Mucilaginibacter paludis]|uniref:Xanthine and CO dehydrogenase maturation factor XdhC/CoxF family-like protein n=1 Tax=Mucilaginibacter paludis DSM 18603 TaxID=714943 RepID=H1Y7Y8_9SPHI|nr:XdhC/CoxI family protein [Mucilaginibacter paludis]EHQ30474.1 xanthine and CO dehydrogenase maturation factor XdhC/CoxF family-like protein [Mucilaginibacter paludis DSM 18603]